MTLIGITGESGSGKSTAAAVALELLDRAGVRAGIGECSEPLFSFFADLGIDLSAKTPQARQALAEAGDAARRFDAAVLAKRALQEVEEECPDPDVAIVCGIRNDAEAEFVRSRGGEVWRILAAGKLADYHADRRACVEIVADHSLPVEAIAPQIRTRLVALGLIRRNPSATVSGMNMGITTA